MKILGISCFYHDSAAALLTEGQITASAQEERFTRKKHDAAFPAEAIKYCLREGKTQLSELDAIVFYEKPFLKFERLIETYLNFAPRGFRSFAKAMPLWMSEKIFMKRVLIEHLEALGAENLKDVGKKLLFSEHHLSHSASAFYASPFDNAAVLTMDGVGEWATTSLAHGSGAQLEMMKEIRFPHSLGLLYSAFTYYTGFKVNSGEYKLMGLAPYGDPKYVDHIKKNLVDIKEDGSFRLNLEYFDYCTGLKMINSKFEKIFDLPTRRPEDQLHQKHMDIAASIQAVTEEIVLKLARFAQRETGAKNLCLAGGVALNCVANGKLLRENIFENLWVQPASGDAGGALGAALAVHHLHFKKPRTPQKTDLMKGSYLGPVFHDAEIEFELKAAGAKYHQFTEAEMIQTTAKALAQEKAVGWFQGRMEYGPRALGGRSIIADPRSAHMQTTLNLKVKFRESFRPFAPSVLREKVAEWFDLTSDSPYMLIVADVKSNHQIKMTDEQKKLFGIEKLKTKRSDIPAVTHVDYSARIQTVHEETNPLYHQLLAEFEKLTGCPVLVNTSFNVRGEPIVCSPTDAFRCFMGSDIDLLVVGNYILHKNEQDPALQKSYKDQFELD